jgi:hypothetical protein
VFQRVWEIMTIDESDCWMELEYWRISGNWTARSTTCQLTSWSEAVLRDRGRPMRDDRFTVGEREAVTGLSPTDTGTLHAGEAMLPAGEAPVDHARASQHDAERISAGSRTVYRNFSCTRRCHQSLR